MQYQYFLLTMNLCFQVNMLMRLQEAASYSSPQSNDSDSTSLDSHSSIQEFSSSSVESTLWVISLWWEDFKQILYRFGISCLERCVWDIDSELSPLMTIYMWTSICILVSLPWISSRGTWRLLNSKAEVVLKGTLSFMTHSNI